MVRENIVVPLLIERNQATATEKLTIAIGNFSYLGTIGDFIKKRVADAGLECQFIEKPPEEIQKLLDEASQQRLISESNLMASNSAMTRYLMHSKVQTRKDRVEGLTSTLTTVMNKSLKSRPLIYQ